MPGFRVRPSHIVQITPLKAQPRSVTDQSGGRGFIGMNSAPIVVNVIRPVADGSYRKFGSSIRKGDPTDPFQQGSSCVKGV